MTTKIEFIDLKAQYADLRESINGRIQRVLDHGQHLALKGRLADLGRRGCGRHWGGRRLRAGDHGNGNRRLFLGPHRGLPARLPRRDDPVFVRHHRLLHEMVGPEDGARRLVAFRAQPLAWRPARSPGL